MITWISLLILVFTAQFNGIEAQKATSLTSKIKDLAAIARLANGIAMETEILHHPVKANEAMAEFMAVRSGGDLLDLNRAGLEDVAKGLGEIFSEVDRVPKMTVDVQAFKNSFEALDSMKGYTDVLNSTSGNNVTNIGSDMRTAGRLSGTITEAKAENFRTAADNLESISKNNFISYIADANKGNLFPLKRAIEDIRSSLSTFKNFRQNFGELLYLHNTTKRISGLANVSEQLIANLDTLSTMGSNLTELKSKVDELEQVVEQMRRNHLLADWMNKTVNVIKAAIGQAPELNFTIGFAGDVSSIANLFQDLKTDYLKKVVSQGKDLKGMADSLKLFATFQSMMQPIQQIWSGALPDNWTSIEEAVEVLTDMTVNNDNAPKASKVSATLSSIQQCFGIFQRPSTVPNLADVSTIATFASNLSQQILDWKTFFEEKESDFDYLDTVLDTLYGIIKPIDASPTNPNRKAVWNSIKNQTENMKTVSVLNGIFKGLDHLLKNSPFTTIENTTLDLSVISGIVSSLNEVNLPGLLTCVEAETAGLPDVTTTLKIGSGVQVIKANRQSFESAKTLFSEVLKVNNGIWDLARVLRNAKRRIRRGAGSPKSLKNLGNAEDVSYNLGLGIQVLHKYAEILEKQDSVMVAVNTVDPLASTVAAIPGVQNIWTNRKSMGVMIDDLNKLEATAGSLKKDNLADLWKIFAEANLVPGVSINATLFDDPISKQLAQNSDPAIQAKATDFEKIGSLDLNFVQHLVNLQKASQTLAPLQTFFDDYFDNNPGGPGAASAGIGQGVFGDESFPIGTIVVSFILFLLAGAAGAGVYFVVKHMREKRLWKDRERHWMYSKMLDGKDDKMSTAVVKDLYSEEKKLLKRGSYINYYESYDMDERLVSGTPLYMAVDYGKPEFVEMLIRAGADRSLRSSDGLTPEQLLKKKLEQLALKKKDEGASQNETQKGEKTQEGKPKDPKEKPKEKAKKSKKEEPEEEDLEYENCKNPVKLQEIEQIFKKYEKKKFRPKVCDSIRIDTFRIDVRDGAKDERKFREKYGHLVSVGASGVILTHWVCKVDKDGVVDIKHLSERYAEILHEVTNIKNGFMNRTFLVNDSWLDACVQDKKNLYKDYEYRVSKVRYNGKVYDTVDEWKKWGLGWAVPCLFNVRVAYVLEGRNPLEVDATKAENIKSSKDKKQQKLKATIEAMKKLLEFLSAQHMELLDLIKRSSKRKDQRPYWFPELNCHWVLYPAAEKENFDAVWEEAKSLCKEVDRTTPFVIMTFEEFFDKLLSLNGYKDLLAAKYPNDGEEQKKDPAQGKDETPTKSSTEQTNPDTSKSKQEKPAKGSSDQSKSKENGSSLTQRSAQGSATKSTTEAAQTSKV